MIDDLCALCSGPTDGPDSYPHVMPDGSIALVCGWCNFELYLLAEERQ